jgi:predicted phosphate transport protein (TIGR00153 family)
MTPRNPKRCRGAGAGSAGSLSQSFYNSRDLVGHPGVGSMSSVANLFRGGDREFFDLFERAGANVVRAAELLDELLAGFPDSGGLARDILVCEQDGDQITHDIVRRLNQTFVTPIDREDILDLVRALDDIVDYTEEVADYLGLYRIEAPMVQAQQLARILRDAAHHVGRAIPQIRGFKDISEHTVEVHRLENEGDRIVRAAIASLFEAGIDPMVVIRWKDLFERLEDAIDSTERAADVLEGIVIKNA